MISYSKVWLVMACTALALLVACGKKDFPQPNDPERNFTIAAANARPHDNCLIVEAQLAGAYTNLEQVRLDVEVLDLENACIECPFVPTETEFLSRRDMTFDVQTGRLSFAYCPQKADIYRWRLSGISRFSSIPHAQSAVMTTPMVRE